MKKIITHISPHLDEIFAIWALKKYDPGFSEIEVKFKATNPTGGEVDLESVDKDPDTVYLGIGRGKFDEHDKKTDQETTAASLVWMDIVDRGLAPTGADLAAVDKLLSFVIKDDTGELKGMGDYLVDYTISALWDGFSKVQRGDSDKKLEYGLPMMDYMFAYLRGIANAEIVLEDAQNFETEWGKGLALSADYKETQVVAYRRGFNIVIVINPKLGYHLILGNPASQVDLTGVFAKLKEIDSEAEWYLHQSKRMLISGSHSAPNVKISKLSLEQMIDLVRK